ncbi:thioredoxin family protein [Cyclobacterium qasimii]|uniref:Alkyl hydroperoxide reductase and/or thiol-specific antioxidant family (AhpC/TSA) protein n=2 Tax=Cyclobacterium qasimii TaxID=1350429 RepID=S7VG00_9BACT|nr:thioredoxin family protein [Cyclobacterium qasimii]EPR68467.1 Alkyl hydroperoxide reductase and/or thiol-specific antioxidant family (AhpC/TSA) protein [Cyclobacterium qasimii M12-11B]GEO23789.1 thioredoxin family protein [Cyclobacterium qasimii]
MRKFSHLLVLVVLTAGLLTSCNNKSKGGERKGPPRGGHNPEQTKTLEEVGGYKIGEVATDFNLKNVDGTMVSLANYEEAKGYIVVFTCNGCPFSKMYEDRLIALHNTYSSKGYPVIAINPNVNENNETENFAAMQIRAKEKDFPFPYLADEKHEIFPKYGAVRTPHVFLLDSERKVQYIGTIDDNAQSADDVKVKYVEKAIEALENGSKPDPNFTKAIGCPVKIG